MVEDASDVLWAIEVDGVELTRVKPGESVVVGRKPIRPMIEADADRRVDVADSEKSMSKRHAKLTVDAYGRAILEDLGSTNGTFVVRDDGGLMRVPLGTQITFQRSPMHLQFGDKAVDFREVSSDDTGEHPVQSLFENLTPDQIANAANGAMSVDQILDVRAGEPTTAFDASAVRGKVHELNTAHLVQAYVTTSPAAEGLVHGAPASDAPESQNERDASARDERIVTESVVAENVVAQATATATVGTDAGNEAASGTMHSEAAAGVAGSLSQTEPVATAQTVVSQAIASQTSASQVAQVESAEDSLPESGADAIDAGAAATEDSAAEPAQAEPVETTEPKDGVATQSQQSQLEHQPERQTEARTTPEAAASESEAQPEIQPETQPEAQTETQPEAQPMPQTQTEASQEPSYPVTASFPISRSYGQAANYSGDYQTTDSSTWPATGQHHGFDSEAANLSAASSTVQTSPTAASGSSAAVASVDGTADASANAGLAAGTAAADARFRPQGDDGRFAVHQQPQHEVRGAQDAAGDGSAFSRASFSTPVTNPRYDAGSVLDRLSNGQFPQQQAEADEDRIIEGFSIRQARTTADYQQQFRMAQHPQLLPFLAMNPSLYGDLYAWLAAQGNADVESALGGNAGYLAWKQGK